ncbi:hypothetical protein ACFYXV_29350 [Streptomyces sp. NPDC002181]|uniref:hypothetical protein n=1 Tax=Streptomyces sp. NPDC002181 TaxID=3364635 RepID=UPI0036C9ABE2
MRPIRIRAALAMTAVATVLTYMGSGTAQAWQGWPEPAAAQSVTPTPSSGTANRCLDPEGTDLNALLSIREQIIGPPACRVAVAMKPWVSVFPSWGTAADAAGAVYPAGYTPSLPKPMDDFILKFLGVRIVQDIGTPQERSFSFGPEVLRLVVIEEGIPFATFASPALPGLRPGTHTSTVFFRMSFEHCDGAGTSREDDCLPAGETAYTGNIAFEVVKQRA